MAQRIGLVLAGGEGTRMGGPKGEIVHGGVTLAQLAARALRPLCGGVVISVAFGARNPAPEFPAIEDPPPPGRGPLAGIQAAFATTGKADLLVLACDYPWITTDLLRTVAGAARPHDDVVLPVDAAGRDHPLAALWLRSAATAVREALDARQYKVQALLAMLQVHRLGGAVLAGYDTRALLRNVNWPEDLAEEPVP